MITEEQVKAKMLFTLNKLKVSAPDGPNDKLVEIIFDICLRKFLNETKTRYDDAMRILVGLEMIEDLFVKTNDRLGVKRGKNGRIKR